MVVFKHNGNFSKTEKFFNTVKGQSYLNSLSKFGDEGVQALSAATPKRTGKTASMWSYKIIRDDNITKIIWSNNNINKWANVAVLIQHGHGTRHGGYVQGIDYVNPAMRPIFESIADDVWKEVVGV